MKTNAIIRIIIFSVIIVMLLSILGVAIAADRFMIRHDFGTNATTSSGSVDADTIRKLSIDWISGAITIRAADVDQIVFTETEAADADPMVWLTAGDTLKISYTQEESLFHIGVVPDKDLLIEVPRNWSCDTLEIDTASADVNLENLNIGKVDFDGASGELDFLDCIVDNLEMDTASGDLRFCGSLNSLDCDGASADCEIILTNCPRRIELDLASGDLDLTLPENCGFTAELESLSGRLNTDFDVSRTGKGLVSGDGSCRIDMSAMSGDVYIHKSTAAKNCDH